MSVRESAELLRCVLHTAAPVDASARLAPLTHRQWADLLRQADAHQVTPLVHRRLQDIDARTPVPEWVLRRTGASYDRAAGRNREIYSELGEVLAALRSVDVLVIVLKGAQLAATVYPDPALRSMADIDLLVRREDIARTAAVLLALGFRQTEPTDGDENYDVHFHLRPFLRHAGWTIEVHRGLDRPISDIGTDMSGIWQRAREAQVAGVPVLVLAPEDLLLHLCLHITLQHRFRVGLRHLIDLPMVVTHFNTAMSWDAFVARARHANAARYAYFALSVTQRLLGCDVPASVMDGLRPTNVDDGILAAMGEYACLQPVHQAPELVCEIRQAAGAIARLGVVGRALFPAPRRLREMYAISPESRWIYGYYLRRPFDLMRRRGGFLLKTAIRDESATLALTLSAHQARIERVLAVPHVRWNAPAVAWLERSEASPDSRAVT